MTEVEAIERILAGQPYTQCAPCLGTGKTGSPFFGDQKLCTSCEGRASYPDPAYAEACRILGRPFPKDKVGPFMQARNSMDLQKLQPEKLIMHPYLYADLAAWGKESK
jgi:hypothetical protein